VAIDKAEKLKELQEDLKLAKEAKRRIMEAQSYSVGRRSLTRVRLDEINREIKHLEDDIETILNPQGRFRTVVVRDW